MSDRNRNIADVDFLARPVFFAMNAALTKPWAVGQACEKTKTEGKEEDSIKLESLRARDLARTATGCAACCSLVKQDKALDNDYAIGRASSRNDKQPSLLVNLTSQRYCSSQQTRATITSIQSENNRNTAHYELPQRKRSERLRCLRELL